LRIYFFFSSGKTLTQFLEFYPQDKTTFSIFLFEPIYIFNFPEKRKKKKLGSCSLLFRPETAHGPQPTRPSRALPRAQAATWAWAGKAARRSRPPGLSLAQLRSAVGSHPTVARPFRSIKSNRSGRVGRNPSSFSAAFSLSSPRSAFFPPRSSSQQVAAATESKQRRRPSDWCRSRPLRRRARSPRG